MSGFPILDLVVGIIFVYFLLSIICSSIVEICLTATRLRAKMLEQWLKRIFDKPVTVGQQQMSLGEAIMNHCGTTALSPKGSATSYIDARNFTSALLEKVTYDPANPKSIARDMDEMIAAIENASMLPDEFKGVILGYAHEVKDGYRNLTVKAKGEMELFKNKIESWYDTNMDRVSGALKMRYTRKFTLWIAIAIALFLNADTISIARYLYKNPEARKEFAAQAYAAANSDSVKAQVHRIVEKNRQRNAPDSVAKDSTATVASHNDSLQMARLTDSIAAEFITVNQSKAILADAIPLGWNDGWFYVEGKNKTCGYLLLILTKLAGLAMTVFAIMMGAPFWFDVLNKISNMRSAGKKPPSSSK